MRFTLAYLTAGALLIVMALTGSVLKRLPLTAAMLYLAVGYGLGPAGVGLVRLDGGTTQAAIAHQGTLRPARK